MPEVMGEVSICDLCKFNNDPNAPCKRNGRHRMNKEAMSKNAPDKTQSCEYSIVNGRRVNLSSYISPYSGDRMIETPAQERSTEA
jgi:hypothetical protein